MVNNHEFTLCVGLDSNELNKILMNLKIFPDLVSNIDVKMIIKRICDKEETAEFKSP